MLRRSVRVGGSLSAVVPAVRGLTVTARVARTAGRAVANGAVRRQAVQFQETRVRQLATAATQSQHMNAVKELLIKEGNIVPAIINQEIAWFYNDLKLHPYYFQRFSPKETAAHIQSFLAAKQVAASSNRPEDITLTMERPDGAFYLCSSDHASRMGVEHHLQRLMDQIAQQKPKRQCSMTHFLSGGPIIPGGKKQLGMYILDSYPVADPKVAETEADLTKIASAEFLSKPAVVQQRYKDLLQESVARMSPILKSYETYRDGTLPLMFAFRSLSTTNPMSSITELLKSNGLSCERKMIENFANGMTIYSLYLHQTPKNKIDDFLIQVGNLFTVPVSQHLTPLFLSGNLSAHEYAYSVSVKRFAFYFMQRDSDEFVTLRNSFKGDPVNLARLEALRRQMKHDSVSEGRIAECIQKYPNLVKELYNDFSELTRPTTTAKQEHLDNKKMRSLIDATVVDDMDREIMSMFLKFNRSVLKTNFYQTTKAALAFRLEPKYFIGENYPAVPFGIFMVMASDFQGFHVRFNDIARGGIRLIKSPNDGVYAKNMESVFNENYNLAHTQNKKNKDIPEFGSKGTVLLNKDKQYASSFAFRKYVGGLLDLLIPSEQVKDHYGKPEILFLGPDENTADVMDWACLYAKRRNYPFWKAFTTGKPPALGGIPHDTYGMTTRSVHKFVTESLKVKGWDEEKMTKLQTGGPDGDLGSNEILLSKDRTMSIVDGSGVLYDPKGINRVELTRLAKLRVPVSNFDVSKLNPGGFLVKTEDRDRVLPNGEKVDSGLVFRNEFHLHPLSTADLFVPCGGRPEAVNSKNVHRMFYADGVTPRFKIVVEGANLFLSSEARQKLEDAGVVLYKDASANKGGVTSSSMEVLAALAMNDSEHATHMCVKDPKHVPEFYAKYVQEVQRRIEDNAALEFHCLHRHFEQTGMSRHLGTDKLSEKIKNLKESIGKSTLWDNKVLRNRILGEAVPSMLTQLVGGMDVIQKRLPENYARALFASYLASRYVYKFGLNADEFAFFQFMENYRS